MPDPRRVPVRIAVAGPPEPALLAAREILALDLGRPVLVGASPREGAEIASHLGGGAEGAVGGRDIGEVEGCDVVVLAGAGAWGPSDLRATADCIARRSPHAIVITAGPGSNAMARAFLAASRLPPRQVIGSGGHAGQRAREADLAAQLGLSRSQVSSLVVGDEGSMLRPLPRYEAAAGVPLRHLLPGPAGSGAASSRRSGSFPGPVALARAAAILAGAVVRDRRRVLSAGTHIEASYGLAAGFLTLPVVVGRRGIESIFPVSLTLEERAFLQRAAASAEGEGPRTADHVRP